MLDNGVRFSCLFPDGEEGYPGNLRVSVTYIWSDDNTLDISYDAAADAPTVVNLTNHAYSVYPTMSVLESLHPSLFGRCLYIVCRES